MDMYENNEKMAAARVLDTRTLETPTRRHPPFLFW